MVGVVASEGVAEHVTVGAGELEGDSDKDGVPEAVLEASAPSESELVGVDVMDALDEGVIEEVCDADCEDDDGTVSDCVDAPDLVAVDVGVGSTYEYDSEKLPSPPPL